MKTLDYLVNSFSLLDFDLDQHSNKRLQRDLMQSALPFSVKKYSSFCLSFSLAISILCFSFSLSFTSLLNAISFSVFVFSVCFVGLLYYPSLLKKRRAAEVERSLPLFLRSIAVDLHLRIPFEKALQNCDGYGILSVEIRKVVLEIQAGYPVQACLLNFSKRVDSLSVKRSVMQLCFSYEKGFEGEGLRKLADEFIQQQRIKSREFAAKQAFFGLLFIAASTIVPALFSAYVMIGSSFLSLTLSQTDVIVFFVFVFPLVDFAILFYLNEVKPKVL